MTDAAPTGDRDPQDLVEAVAALVGTGAVRLGAYTPAEIAAVGARLEWLDDAPEATAVGEAVRSLAARDLITTEPGSDELEVRGDLGIALTFQQRSRVVLDARLTHTDPDTPWRVVLMPQPEQVALEVLIDALGIHFYALHGTGDALDRLHQRLPGGDRGPKDAALDATLDGADATALVTVTRWRDGGDRESTDVVLASAKDTLHVFMRDDADPATLTARGLDGDQVRTLLGRLSDPEPARTR